MKKAVKNENVVKPIKENPIHVVKNDPSEKYVLPDKEEVLKITDELLEKHSAVFEALAK